MKKSLSSLVIPTALILGGLFVTAVPVSASTRCEYSSTQARVQKDLKDPWKQSMTVGCFDNFNVGSFHNHTGQFANDTELKVVMDTRLPVIGRIKLKQFFKNGEDVPVAFPGTYTLQVTTDDQSGSSCEHQAKVIVKCDKFIQRLKGWRLN